MSPSWCKLLSVTDWVWTVLSHSSVMRLHFLIFALQRELGLIEPTWVVHYLMKVNESFRVSYLFLELLIHFVKQGIDYVPTHYMALSINFFYYIQNLSLTRKWIFQRQWWWHQHPSTWTAEEKHKTSQLGRPGFKGQMGVLQTQEEHCSTQGNCTLEALRSNSPVEMWTCGKLNPNFQSTCLCINNFKKWLQWVHLHYKKLAKNGKCYKSISL